MPDLVIGSIQGRVWGVVAQRRKKNMPTARGEMAWEDIAEKLKIVYSKLKRGNVSSKLCFDRAWSHFWDVPGKIGTRLSLNPKRKCSGIRRVSFPRLPRRWGMRSTRGGGDRPVCPSSAVNLLILSSSTSRCPGSQLATQQRTLKWPWLT